MSITKEQVLQMDWKAVQLAIKTPESSATMQTLLRDRAVVSYVSKLMLDAQNREAEVDAQIAVTIPPSTEELAAQATVMADSTATAVADPQVPVAPVTPPASPVQPANHEEEDAEWKSAGVTVTRDASGKGTRYVEEYQVRDEDGTPIGRPTHLEASSLPALAVKKREAHENATRAFHRLKKQKLTFKEKTVFTPEQIQEAARVALEEKDVTKASDVIREVLETSFKKRDQDLQAKIWQEDGRAISNEFMRRHLHDYVPCDANFKVMDEYFKENNLIFTLDNLEAAFQVLKEQGNKLAKAEPSATVPAVVAANPVAPAVVATPAPPVIPVAETPAATPVLVVPAQPPVVVTPVVAATAPTPAVPNQHTTARRPGVNGSLPPGTLSAQRPGTPDPALGRKEFLKTVKDMAPEVMKNKIKTDPQFVKTLESYGIRVR
jgi:hypothetical protein